MPHLVLVVHSPDVAPTSRDLLERAGYEVRTSVPSRAGHRARRLRPDLIVVEARSASEAPTPPLPPARVRVRPPGAPVLVLKDPGVALEDSIGGIGPVSVLVTPVHPQQLLLEVQRLMRSAAPVRPLRTHPAGPAATGGRSPWKDPRMRKTWGSSIP